MFSKILRKLHNFILIPLYGINGAAFATTFSLIMLNLNFLFFSNRELNIIPFRAKMIDITIYTFILSGGLIPFAFFYDSLSVLFS